MGREIFEIERTFLGLVKRALKASRDPIYLIVEMFDMGRSGEQRYIR